MIWRLTIVLLLLCAQARGATINAATAARSDVVAAIALAVDGDTVAVPAGAASWTTTVTNTKAITLQGAGVDVTRIIDDISTAGGGAQNIIQWNNTSTAYINRLTAFTFTNGSSAGRGYDRGALQFSGLTTSLRIDHIECRNLDNENIYVEDCFGVIDHVTWEMNAGGYRCVMFFHPNIFGGINGNGSWETAYDWGGNKALYVEDFVAYKDSGTFYGFCDGWKGGRLVLRFGSLKNLMIANHGTESSQIYRGGRSFEIYKLNITNSMGFQDHEYLQRSGSSVIFSNNVWGDNFDRTFKLESYRRTGAFAPWGSADGLHAWDTALLTDGAGTPGGAGDGVYESGTASSGGVNTMADTTKTWTPSAWINYQVVQSIPFTAASGGLRSAVVTAAGWATDQWADWEFTKTSDNKKSHVLSNTSDTLTLDSGYYALDMTGGGAFTLTLNALIVGNTTTALTVSPTIEGHNYVLTNAAYTIRNLDLVLDDPGRGQTVAYSGSPPNHQSLSQQLETCYSWNNLEDGVAVNFLTPWPNIVDGRNMSNGAARPAYTSYTYPYPAFGGAQSSYAPAAMGIRGVTLRAK